MTDQSFWDKHSNNTSEWYTPLEIYKELHDEFHFTTDISAEPTNRLGCEVFITKDVDALRNRHLWRGNVFSNPPYSTPESPVYEWVKAAKEYAQTSGNITVLLIRATPSVKWFQDFIWDGTKHQFQDNVEVRFPSRRIKFAQVKEGEHGNRQEVMPGSPTFDSMVVIFHFQNGSPGRASKQRSWISNRDCPNPIKNGGELIEKMSSSGLAEEIRKLQRETTSEFLKIEDGQTVVVKLDLNEDGSVKGQIFDRKYKDKVSKAVKFPITEVNTGQRKMLGLALTWALNLIEIAERKKMNVVEITRHGKDTSTSYNFQAVGSA